jgi:hypothetical protein
MESVLKGCILMLLVAVSGLTLQALDCGSAPVARGNIVRAQRATSAKTRYVSRKRKLPRSAGVIGCMVAPPVPKAPDISPALPPELFLFQGKPPVLEQQSRK